MEQFSGYTEESLSEVIKEVKSFCMEINPKFISTLKYKFNKAEYGEVAKHQFKFWETEFLWKKLCKKSKFHWRSILIWRILSKFVKKLDYKEL